MQFPVGGAQITSMCNKLHWKHVLGNFEKEWWEIDFGCRRVTRPCPQLVPADVQGQIRAIEKALKSRITYAFHRYQQRGRVANECMYKEHCARWLLKSGLVAVQTDKDDGLYICPRQALQRLVSYKLVPPFYINCPTKLIHRKRLLSDMGSALKHSEKHLA